MYRKCLTCKFHAYMHSYLEQGTANAIYDKMLLINQLINCIFINITKIGQNVGTLVVSAVSFMHKIAT